MRGHYVGKYYVFLFRISVLFRFYLYIVSRMRATITEKSLNSLSGYEVLLGFEYLKIKYIFVTLSCGLPLVG